MKYPTCPHCRYEFDEDETWYSGSDKNQVYSGDGDTSELKCHNDDCGKMFGVVCVHNITWKEDEDYEENTND